ncbi:DNA helicase, partial [Acinetobacter baumannii]
QHFNKYGCSPDPASVVQIIKDKAASKVYKRETLAAIVEARKKLIGIYVTDKAFVEEKVVEFARKQAVSNAIVNSVPDLEAGNYAKIE